MQRKILEACSNDWATAAEIAAHIGVALTSGQFRDNVEHLVKGGYVDHLFPDSPRDRRQKYRIATKHEKNDS